MGSGKKASENASADEGSSFNPGQSRLLEHLTQRFVERMLASGLIEPIGPEAQHAHEGIPEPGEHRPAEPTGLDPNAFGTSIGPLLGFDVALAAVRSQRFQVEDQVITYARGVVDAQGWVKTEAYRRPLEGSEGQEGWSALRIEEALIRASHILFAPGEINYDELLETVGSCTGAQGVYLQIVAPDDFTQEEGEPEAEPEPLLWSWQRGAYGDGSTLSSILRAARWEGGYRLDRALSEPKHEVLAVPMLSTRGELYGYLGLVYDIAWHLPKSEDLRLLNVLGDLLASTFERNLAEKALAQSEERWRSLVENHPEPIVVTVDGHIRYINASGLRVFGARSFEELDGRSWFDFFSAEYHELVESRLRTLRHGRPTQPLQHEIIRLDGEWRLVESFAIPVMFEGKAAAQTVLRDLTERQRSENRYRTFVETISEGIWRIELERPVPADSSPAHQMQHILTHGFLAECNRVTATLLGAAGPEELIGRRVSSLVNSRELFEQFFTSGYRLRNFQISTGSGRDMRHFVLNAVGTIERGQLVACWGSCVEVTERVDQERRMVSALEEQQQRIGRELHDGVGQLLTGVRMLSQALVDMLSDDHSEQRAIALKVLKFADDASKQVRTIYSGLTPAQLDVDGIVPALRELVGNTNALPGVRCSFTYDGKAEVHDAEVRHHVYRIVQEAINNALKHARARHIRVTLKREGADLLFQVEDDGVGFDAKRVASESLKKSKRKSLGVTSMFYRARAIKGDLQIHSSSGCGTTIVLQLPL